MSHEVVEKNVGLLAILVILVISVGGLVEIVPLFYIQDTIEKVEGVRPYTPLEQRGRDIYAREGCYTCHSQMIRPFRNETERYGQFSHVGEFVYDRPFLWGSRRIGPDLHRVGGRYSNGWHMRHLLAPKDVTNSPNIRETDFPRRAACFFS